MALIPVPDFPVDFGGTTGEELTNEAWLAVYRNMLEEYFSFGDRAQGHTFSSKVVVVFRNDRDPDSFNDLAGGYDLVSGELRLWRATGNPGAEPMQRIAKLGAPEGGVARLAVGMTRNCYGYGFHHNDLRHPCLRQAAVIPFERFDVETQTWYSPEVQTIRGFNVHRAKFTGSARYVGDWSLGCITFANRMAHWQYLTWMGYPVHGPSQAPAAVRSRRHSILVLDITTPLSEESE